MSGVSRLRGRSGLPLALAAAMLVSCRGGDRFPQAPIVIISIDTLRSDHVGAYGATNGTTPRLDAFAREAILFERAYSHYPLTLPSHVSLLTGELPPVHGVRDNVGYPFAADRHPFLPRLLKAAGYETGAAISAFVLRPETGFAGGFDFYDGKLRPHAGQSLDMVQRAGGDSARVALDWIRGRAGGDHPFFFFLHLYEPHSPYEPPPAHAARFSDPYDGEVAAADEVVGNFLSELRALGVYDRAIVLVVSDHGEGLGEHGEAQHGMFLYRESLQVPLLLKLPRGARGGTRVKSPVQLVDVVPTLLPLVGVATPAGLPGSSLLAENVAAEREIYAETYYPRLHHGWSELASMIAGRFHYIDGPQPELFDVAADPAERVDVLARERRTYAALRAALAKVPRQLAAPQAVDAETARQLAALGYAAGSAQAEGPRPDPRSKRQAIGDIGRAIAAAQAGRHEEAAAIYVRLLAAEPQMPDGWAFYARTLEKLGRAADAARAYEKSLELGGMQPQLAVTTAGKLADLGQLDDAERLAAAMLREAPAGAYEVMGKVAVARHDLGRARDLLAQAIAAGQASEPLRRTVALALAEAGHSAEAVAALQPLSGEGEPPTLNVLAIALSDAGRQQEAMAVLRRAVAADPDGAVAYQTMGMVALRLQRAEEARAHLERALALNSELPIAWNTLGVVRFQLDGPPAALEAWQRSVALDPRQYDALYNIGLVAAASGRRDDARAALRQFVSTAPPARFAADIRKARSLLQELGG